MFSTIKVHYFTTWTEFTGKERKQKGNWEEEDPEREGGVGKEGREEARPHSFEQTSPLPILMETDIRHILKH